MEISVCEYQHNIRLQDYFSNTKNLYFKVIATAIEYTFMAQLNYVLV